MTAPRHILAIDDESHNLIIIEKIFQDDRRFHIVSAESAEKGWEILEESKEPIRVILLDRMMDPMDGMQFLEKLKADERFKNIPVIMQTAADEIKEMEEGLHGGVYHYLTKPFSEHVLKDLVEKAAYVNI